MRGIQVTFDGPPLLDNLSFDVQKGQRIGILGRNGAGKSTLLRLIAGSMRPDAGDIILSASLKVSFLTQDVPDTLTGTAFEVVAAGAGPAGEALSAYYRALGAGDHEALHSIQDDLTAHDGWKVEAVVKRVLDQVQVAPDLAFASLSGGMRRRVFLARALVREPDVLLLDEPTNHLDLESIAWLETFLLSSRLTVLFVTHDRRLLRRLADRIVEIDRGKIVDWSCDYPTFLQRKQAVLDNEVRAWELFDKKLAQEEIWIRQGVKARRTRAEGRVTALKKMREERRKRRNLTGQAVMTISTSARSGDRVLEVKNISFAFGPTPIIKNFSFSLTRGDRIGIIGPNGCGKTTLLNLLLGTLTPDKGHIERGTTVLPLYFDQLRTGIDPEKTVWENVVPTGGDTVFINGKPRHAISYLQDFLFTSDRAKTLVKKLSGGERHRLLLARLFTVPSNLLVFDEPTNDLDTETLELLEEVLLDYQGTLIVVSHDREFLNNVVTSALIFRPGHTVKEFIGGYDDWQRQLTAADIKPAAATVIKKTKTPAPDNAEAARKLTFKETQELKTLPAHIESLENEQREILQQLTDIERCRQPGFVAQSKSRLATITAELATTYARWEELEAQLRSYLPT